MYCALYGDGQIVPLACDRIAYQVALTHLVIVT
jgi:hypothetical protein